MFIGTYIEQQQGQGYIWTPFSHYMQFGKKVAVTLTYTKFYHRTTLSSHRHSHKKSQVVADNYLSQILTMTLLLHHKF